MVLFNGQLLTDSNILNRGLLYGDGVFETMKIDHGVILFLEDHYFRLMASMRVCRMEIPMHFTMEYLEEQIRSLLQATGLSNARVRITIFRSGGGYYTPASKEVSYIMTASELVPDYLFSTEFFEVDLYKDFFIPAQHLSSIKTTNKMVHVLAGVYAAENKLHSCLLLNEKKQVIEAIQGNLFMVVGNKLITPPVADGCLNGIMRKQVLMLAKAEGIEIIECAIAPFELQNADELFITNVITGIQPVSRYRKKDFQVKMSQFLALKLQQYTSGLIQ